MQKKIKSTIENKERKKKESGQEYQTKKLPIKSNKIINKTK